MLPPLRVAEERESRKCPFLDTVDRKVLDFDLEKECSICLSHQNVYICLVCGCYLHGRGENTHAYTHSLQNDHHVFLNIATKKFYCIPDNYEITDPYLDDIRAALDPEFTEADLNQLDKNKTFYHVPSGDEYLPGMMGMNVLGKGDYINVVVQALSHVAPIRDFFLIPSNYAYSKSPLVHSFGMLMRKLWSHTRFSAHVSPHEFVNEVTRSSKERFTVKARSDAAEFLRWLVNALHAGLKDKEHKTTVVEACFKGKIEITTKKYTETQKRSHEEMETGVAREQGEYTVETTTRSSDYLMLSLDLPPVPLFKNENKESVVSQIPLYSLLGKYDGVTLTKEIWNNIEKTYRVTRLPRFLVFTINRLKKNEFFVEKDSSIVLFPVQNLEMRDFFFPPVRAASREVVCKMSETPLKAFITHNGESIEGCDSVAKLREKALEMVARGGMLLPNMTSTKYDLVGSICHDVELKDEEREGVQSDLKSNPLDLGTYRIHLRNNGSNAWYEIQELVVTKVFPEDVCVSESSILVYERKDSPVCYSHAQTVLISLSSVSLLVNWMTSVLNRMGCEARCVIPIPIPVLFLSIHR